MITPLELTNKLVSLPSYVSDDQDEVPVTDFLAEFLPKTFPGMILEKQYLKNTKRCNLILRGKRKPKLFVLGHIDTVQPKDGWGTDPFQPSIKDGKLYGLGASDMKGSLAAFLCALAQERQNIRTDELMLLMYVDEEYDFKGIKSFLADNASDISPSLTLSLDGELSVATGCRGLIEINFIAKGKSGHAANPCDGVNAITETVEALQVVSKDLMGFDDVELGPTTTNLASMRGGVLKKNADEIVWLREGNVIPDTAEVIFEVRPATSQVTAEFVLKKIQAALARRGLSLANSFIRHDIAPWPVKYDKVVLDLIKKSYAEADIPFRLSDRKMQGYIDAQMVADKIVAPAFIIGTGGSNKHGANENVPLENLEAATRIYAALLREVLV